MSKLYVDVTAHFDTEGNMTPLSIIWKDDAFEVDRVLDQRRAASLKAGGFGERYTVQIMGKQRYLFYEDGRWFMESRD